MSQFKNLLAGLTGAIALNILHETVRKTSANAPRIDLLGEEALQKTLNHLYYQRLLLLALPQV